MKTGKVTILVSCTLSVDNPCHTGLWSAGNAGTEIAEVAAMETDPCYEVKLRCNFCAHVWVEGFYDGGYGEWWALFNPDCRCPECGEFNSTDDMVT